MTELFANAIEAEIDQLSKEIEAKRRELETARGVSHESESDKEIVRASLAEKIHSPSSVPSQVPVSSAAPASPVVSYLDDLDADTAEKVNMLIQEVFSKGLEAAIKDARREDPYVLDAFHDALVDRMYDELKARKAVK